jgi:hypothetical protein
MGLFKQMKDMKNMVETAPETIRSARSLGAQAQEMAAAQRAAAESQMAAFNQPDPATAPAGAASSSEPVAGVSLALYAEISKGLTAYGYDQSNAVEVAAAKGVSSDDWAAALEGWNARIEADRSVASEFNRLYTAS